MGVGAGLSTYVVVVQKFTFAISSPDEFLLKLECGPMPNAMAALSNIGGALCSTPQSLADAHYWSTVQ